AAFAIPANTVQQIVPLLDDNVSSVNGDPILRIRGDLHPLLDCSAAFEAESAEIGRTALIVADDDHTAALRVNRVLGHQDVVVEAIGIDEAHHGPFLGGAIKNDGSVALVVDVAKLLGSTAVTVA
ncbi:MAG: chemotaxis protein CheW, partial [Planctomycetota bacterium]